MSALYVALGGALGALARFGVVGLSARVFGSGFPYGTLIANIAGSFAMGVIAVGLVRWFGEAGSQTARLFIMTGLLGGFTTFSAFSLDAVSLFEAGRTGAALGYIVISVLTSIFALVLGMALAKAIIS